MKIAKAPASSMDTYIKFLDKNLPLMCRAKDLVQIGLFTSHAAISRGKKMGNIPSHIEVNPRVTLFTKESVLEWVKQKWK